ncbi:hypothetical protein OEQ62_001232 [Campylobacter upsaliensis]|nr:hypothetical protein [Campylobacter upsaliensis]
MKIKGSFYSRKKIEMADRLREKYCLFVVKNLKEKPIESLFFDHIKSFTFKMLEQKIMQISYQGAV